MKKLTLILWLMLALVPMSRAQEVVIIEMKDYKFIPAEVTVKAGTTVRWVNKESRQYHSVWFKAEGLPPGDYLWPEERFERTFDKAGDYPYVCEPHEKSDNMRGIVHVEAK